MFIKSIRLPFFLSCLLLFPSHVFAQNNSFWKDGYYKDLGNSYIEVATGEGRTIEEARKIAAKTMIAKRLIAAGGHFNVNIENNSISVSGDESLSVQARIIDEDISSDKSNWYQAKLLVQMAKNPSYNLEPIELTEKYNCVAESFIPGMAQIKKGQTGKGVFFIAAEAACIGTLIVAEAQRSSYESKMKTSQSAQQILSYKDKSDSWSTVRNVAIAGAAAFYVWNVIDGIVAKGKKHIQIGGKDVSMAPWATPDASGLAMRVTF